MPPVRSLPRTVGDFTGRAELIARLVSMVDPAAPGGPVGRAHLGLGDCERDPEAAREHWRVAARIFTRLEVPERHTARARRQEDDWQKADTGVSH